MNATTLASTWLACRSSLETQETPREASCQESWLSISAAETLNRLCSRAMRDFSTCRFPLSELFSGSRSDTWQRPTIIAMSHLNPVFRGPGCLFRLFRPLQLRQRGQVIRLLQAEVFQEAEGGPVQVGPAGRRRPPDLRDEVPSLERGDRPVAALAENPLHFGAGDRLLVGDDRQRGERRVG